MNKVDYSNYNARVDGTYEQIWRNTGKCVFCDLKDKYIITEKNGMVLTVQLFPYIDGHLLIIPRKHYESFDGLTDIEWKTTMELSKIGRKLIIDTIGEKDDVCFLFRMPPGFKAGKTVSHAHAHLIPYNPNLFKWEYQYIKIPPVKLAEDMRKIIKKYHE